MAAVSLGEYVGVINAFGEEVVGRMANIQTLRGMTNEMNEQQQPLMGKHIHPV